MRSRIPLALALLALWAGVANGAYRDVVQADSPIYYWPMDESSGTSLAATVGSTAITLTNGPLVAQTGQVDGTAVAFDGSNDYAKTASTLNLSAYHAITVECLFKWTSYGTGDKLLMEFTANAASNSGGFNIDPDENTGTFTTVARGGTGAGIVKFPRPTANTWHHLVVTYDFTLTSVETKLWVDGVIVNSSSRTVVNNAASSTFANSTLNLFSRNGASLFGAGSMQHLAIYSSLTPARIRAHYTSAFGSAPPLSPDNTELWDNLKDGVEVPRQGCGSWLQFTTDHTSMDVTGTTGIYTAFPAWAQLSWKKDSVLQTTMDFTANGTQTFSSLSLGAGTKTIEIYTGLQANSSGVVGSFIDSIAFSGGTGYTVVAPDSTNRIIAYGDSIASGANATTPELEGWASLLRFSYGRRAANETYGSRKFADDVATTGALDTTKSQAIADRFAAYSPKILVFTMGTNDYGLNAWSAANFGTALADFLDRFHTAAPSAKVILISPLQRVSPVNENANGSGSTLGDYRSQESTIASTRTSWIDYHDGAAGAIVSNGQLDDGLHPTTAGHATFATAINGWIDAFLPRTPTIGTATADSTSQITVTWTDNSSNETGYTIRYSTSADFSGASTTTAAANATSKAITGLSGSTTYYFGVKAGGASFDSDYSGTANATTPASNQSPTAAITSPSTGTAIARGTSITLIGTGTDPEDGSLSGSSLLWVSSIDGPLGSGSSISVSNLSYGKHTMTLTARDHLLASGTATIILFVNVTAAAMPDYFVKPSGGNDSNDGSTWALAKATIQGAVTAAGTAGGTKVIGVAPGTYAEAGTSGRISYTATQSGDTITVQRYAGADSGGNTPYTDAACTLASTAFNALWFKTDCTAGTFVWDGIDITTTDTNQTIDLDDATLTGTLTLTVKNCTLNGWMYPVGVKASQKQYRNLVFDNVTINPLGGSVAMTTNANAAVTFTNCSLTATSATSPADAFFSFGSAASASLGLMKFTNCTFNVTGNTSSPKSLIKVYNVSTTGNLIVTGCTLTNTYSTVEVLPITSSAVDVIIDGNTLTTDTTGSSADTYGVHIGSDTDTTTYSLGVVRIQNNTIYHKGTGSGASVIMGIGPECTGAEISYNKILGQDYWNPTLGGADGKGLGVYLRGCANVSFHHNAVWARGALVNVMADGMKATQNTFRSDHGSSTNGATVFIRDQNTTGVTDTKNVVFTHNILQAGASTDYVFSIAPHDGAMNANGWIVDRNAYFKTGTTGASNSFYLISGAGAFTGLSTFWAAQGGVSTINDQNSKYGDPVLSNYLTISGSSAAKGAQTNPPTYRWNDWGAFSRKAGAGQSSLVGDNP